MADRAAPRSRPLPPRIAALAGASGIFAALLGVDPAIAAEPAGAPTSAPPPAPAAAPLSPPAPPKAALHPELTYHPAAPPPSLVELAAYLGPSFRLGGSASYDVRSHGGIGIGASAFFVPSPRFALGLAYEHTQLGAEHGGGPEVDSVDVSRALDTLWIALRLRAVDLPAVRLHVVIGPGIVWQSASASAVLSTDVGAPPVGVACSVGGSANLGLRAGVGVDFPLGSVASLGVHGAVDTLRLSSDPLGTCVLGPGATTLISARAGFSFAFDVTRAVR